MSPCIAGWFSRIKRSTSTCSFFNLLGYYLTFKIYTYKYTKYNLKLSPVSTGTTDKSNIICQWITIVSSFIFIFITRLSLLILTTVLYFSLPIVIHFLHKRSEIMSAIFIPRLSTDTRLSYSFHKSCIIQFQRYCVRKEFKPSCHVPKKNMFQDNIFNGWQWCPKRISDYIR